MRRLRPLTVPLQGTTLIEASAGTGKTYTITTLYLRLLLEKRLTVRDILVVTFTNAATAELRDRLRRHLRRAVAAIEAGGQSDDSTLAELLGKRLANGSGREDHKRLLEAVHGFDEAAVFTIHGFCQRVLQENAFESAVPFDTELITDQSSIVTDVVYDFWVRELHDAEPVFVAQLEAEKVSPSSLERLASTAVAHRYVDVLPAADANPETQCKEALLEWRNAHDAAATIWAAEQETVIARLSDTATMNRVQYREDQVRSTWRAEMERELGDPKPGLAARWSRFVKFTNAGVQRGTKKGRTPPRHPFFDAWDLLAAAEEQLTGILQKSVLAFKLRLVDEARGEVRRRKERARVQSFDDLLHYVMEALRGSGGRGLARSIRQRFQAALIDEFQDTDPVQYEIFRSIYHGSDGALFLIGDPKQAIYAFRGADVFAYIDARGDAGANTWTLTTNWRSDPQLIDAVNVLYRDRKREFWLPQIRFQKTDPQPAAENRLASSSGCRSPFRLLFVRRDDLPLTNKGLIRKNAGRRAVTQAVAAEIARFLDSDTTIDGRPVQPADVAVLCRTNLQAAQMQAALRSCNVHSVLQSEASVFETREAVEVQRLLHAMADPADAGALKAALATSTLGVDADTLVRLEADEGEWDRWVTRFTEWHRRWNHDGFVPAFRHVLESQDVQARLLGLVAGERRMTNVLHLVELLHGASVELALGPRGLLRWLERARGGDERAALAAEAAQIRLESDAAAVKLLTVHKSKGLEYPVVFCPFLWDAHGGDTHTVTLFHDEEDGNRAKLDLGSAEHDEHEARADEEDLAEGLRLLYVAVTRARHACILVWGAFNEAQGSPLGHILHQAPNGSGETVREDTQSRIASLDDDALRGDLEDLAQRSGGTVTVEDLPLETYVRRRTADREAETLHCRPTRRELTLHWRLSSFSSLTFAADTVARPAAEGVDHDTAPTTDEPASPVPAARGTAAVPLADFEGGARSGRFFHKLFETLDFQEPDDDALREHVRTTMISYGLHQEHSAAWLEALRASVRHVLETPLADGAPSWALRDVAKSERLNEMEFVFPVCAPRADGDACTVAAVAQAPFLQAGHLAAVFERHGSADVAAYAPRLRELAFPALAGYLRGFVDLVFRHGDRWYVVDYKSNRLGPFPQDYAPERLPRIMAEHHFYLQYHIYVVALHLHLQRQLPGYDYERDFGGVYYLFLRGMSPAHPRRTGVFHDRPRRALVENLCRALQAPGAEP